MANKIKLGNCPKTFAPAPVEFPMPDGTDGVITCTFKYRTRKEFGELVDSMFEDAGEARPANEKFSMAALMERTTEKNAEYLEKVIDAWDLDVPVNAENLDQLANELPAGAAAIMEKYRTAVVDGRLGN